MYTDALNGSPVHFRVLQSGGSGPARLGLCALEQWQPPRASALAQRAGAGICDVHFRKLVDSSVWSGPLPESDKLESLPERRVVFGARRDLSFATRSVVCHWFQGTSETASFHSRNIGVGAGSVACLRVEIPHLMVSRDGRLDFHLSKRPRSPRPNSVTQSDLVNVIPVGTDAFPAVRLVRLTGTGSDWLRLT
jgi:hypothetical protein